MIVATLTTLICTLSPSSRPDGRELMELLRGLHSQIRDFELVWEGRLAFAETAPDLRANGPKNIEDVFQGSYAFRMSDGAASYDLYQKHLDPSAPFLHCVYAQIGGTIAREISSSDRNQPNSGSISRRQGGAGGFQFVNSAERYIYYGYWRGLGYSTEKVAYDCEGWEEIDGHPVLRITLVHNPGSKPAERILSRLWMDLGRGGHVLKHDFYYGSELWWRMHSIKLSLMPSQGGREVWFPIHGEYDSFLWGEGCRKEPVLHETSYLVRGSLVFDRGLGDERFSLRWKGHRAQSDSFRNAAGEFKKEDEMPSPRPVRTDPAGVEEDLQRRLAEADRQAVQIGASPSSRGVLSVSFLVQLVLALAGTAALLGAVAIRRRRT